MSPRPRAPKKPAIPAPIRVIPAAALAAVPTPNKAARAPPAAISPPSLIIPSLSSALNAVPKFVKNLARFSPPPLFIISMALSDAAKAVKNAAIPPPTSAIPAPAAVPLPIVPNNAPPSNTVPRALNPFSLKASKPCPKFVSNFLRLSPLPNFCMMASAPASPTKKAPIPAPAAPIPTPAPASIPPSPPNPPRLRRLLFVVPPAFAVLAFVVVLPLSLRSSNPTRA